MLLRSVGCCRWWSTEAAPRSASSSAGSARRPSSATASGSPTPRPSISPAWCWSARSTGTSSRPSTCTAHWPSACRARTPTSSPPSARSGPLGYVGDVLDVDPTIVQRLLAEGLIPVVATIGADRAGPGLQHQRRHRGRGRGRGPGGREADLPHRRGGRAGRPGSTRPPCAARSPPSELDALVAPAARPGRDGAQGRGLQPGRARRGGPGPHPRRPGAPRPPARAVHRRRGGHDGACRHERTGPLGAHAHLPASPRSPSCGARGRSSSTPRGGGTSTSSAGWR